MVTKILKTTGIIILLLTLWACPMEPMCPNELDTYIPDLISIEPLDTVYQVGDQIVYTAIIPSRIDSLNIDIYENTGVTSIWLLSSEIHKFDGNDIDVIKGFTRRLDYDNSLQAYLTYNPTDKVYEFQARIIFTQPGDYSVFPDGMEVFFNSENSSSLDYEIKTNIQGFEIGEMWEFRVVP